MRARSAVGAEVELVDVPVRAKYAFTVSETSGPAPGVSKQPQILVARNPQSNLLRPTSSKKQVSSMNLAASASLPAYRAGSKLNKPLTHAAYRESLSHV